VNDPSARRMARNIEVQDLPTIMADDEKTVEHAKGDRCTVKKSIAAIASPVIPQECKPARRRFRISRCSPHPTRDGSLRYIESEHQELSMDARCAPGWILGDHSKYQVSNFLRIRFLPIIRRALEIARQYTANPARCQRTTVSGFTTIRACFQPDQNL